MKNEHQTTNSGGDAFDWDSRLPAGRETFLPREIGKLTGTTDKHIIHLVEAGTLKALDMRRRPRLSKLRCIGRRKSRKNLSVHIARALDSAGAESRVCLACSGQLNVK